MTAARAIDRLEAAEGSQRIAPAPVFEPTSEGRYRLTVPGVCALEVDYLRRKDHELKGELLVRCELPGAHTFGGVLSVADLNLSSSRARRDLARYLAERARTADDVDWTGLLEEFAQRVLSAERSGSPAVLLHEVPRAPQAEALEVDGLPLLSRHPTVIFGDGGTAKSYIALYVAGRIAKQGWRVALFDWELAAADHRERLERLFGASMPPVYYARCTRPLVYESDRLRRVVRDEGIEFAVFDSVAFACDGPPEAAEVAGRYFQALRQLGEIGSLHVAHVAKALEGADLKPFGSVFWHNGFRSSWNVKLDDSAPGAAAINVALHHRKANLGAKASSIGFSFTFGEERTVVERIDVADVPGLAAGLSVRQRMATALRRGALTVDALASEIDATADTVSRTARRHKAQFRLIDGGRIGLAEDRR